MAPHSSTRAWQIPWMEEPGGLQSMGLLRVGHDWATSLSLSCIGEGNGNPLQCSCLENPRDGGAWWAAVYGVTQSWTRLKWLSSSSSSSTSVISFLCRAQSTFSPLILGSNSYSLGILKTRFKSVSDGKSDVRFLFLWDWCLFPYLEAFKTLSLFLGFWNFYESLGMDINIYLLGTWWALSIWRFMLSPSSEKFSIMFLILLFALFLVLSQTHNECVLTF